MSSSEFRNFQSETVQYLHSLKNNNSRDWFLKNKKRYETAFKIPAHLFAQSLATRLEKLTQLSHKAKIFRVNRDLRFSKDKTPYNTHIHISFTPEITGVSKPCWFFGLNTNKVTLGAGIFGFDALLLDTWRSTVAGPKGSELAKIIGSLINQGSTIHDPELKRVPAGFAKEHKQENLLRRKSLSIWRETAHTDKVTEPDYLDQCEQQFATFLPVTKWLLELNR